MSGPVDREEEEGETDMEIDVKKEGDALTIKLEGRLDANEATKLNAVIEEQTRDVNSLTLDLEKLDYIASAGLRVLLAAHKKMRNAGGMKLVHVGSNVMEVFEITGFLEILEVE